MPIGQGRLLHQPISLSRNFELSMPVEEEDICLAPDMMYSLLVGKSILRTTWRSINHLRSTKTDVLDARRGIGILVLHFDAWSPCPVLHTHEPHTWR